MNTDQLLRVLQESAMLMKHGVNFSGLKGDGLSNRIYQADELDEFKRDLTETGNALRLLFMEYTLSPEAFRELLLELEYPVLLFQTEGDHITPQIIYKSKGALTKVSFLETGNKQEAFQLAANNLFDGGQEITFFAIAAYDNLVSESSAEEHEKEIAPVSRLLKLLKGEKKDILYILFYAVIVGCISLILPLGIQTTVELVSGGVFFSSIYVMITLIIVGVLVAGGLQIVQLTMVEYLQQRIFTKASYEFAYRLPRLKNEALSGQYPPELVNRFFDVLTIQKSLPKLLIDLSSASLQIFFGLVLISLYHPFFVFFGIMLILVLFFIFFFTGPKGLQSSISESKYKYKVVYWLQELGRTINSFKVVGNTYLPIRRTDANVNNYLKYRKGHFDTLVTQYWYIVLFKAAITAALLIMGTALVVQRQITLGQFVASEVIIILILNSVEKIITYMDVVYDLLTAVDKIGHVTDLPLEKTGGVDLPKAMAQQPIAINIKNLKYKFAGASGYTLNNINLSIAPGERLCIAGPGDAGKSTLTNLITGLYHDFEGILTFNGFSVRDLDITNLRDKIAKNISPEDLFDGTVLENITVGKLGATVQDAIAALEKTGLSDWVNSLPEGLSTTIVSGGKGLPSSVIQKLILARCLAERPTLIILQDFFHGLRKSDKIQLINTVINHSQHWTLVAVSNDPIVMAACDRIVILDNGNIIAEGTFQQLLQSNSLHEFID
jgi:ABC-type bacteriocin/lantibiotic exporter with double-glycine peptidase domain